MKLAKVIKPTNGYMMLTDDEEIVGKVEFDTKVPSLRLENGIKLSVLNLRQIAWLMETYVESQTDE